MRIIENLVFKGGGVLGTAYVGAFQALQNVKLAGRDGDNPLGNIKSVAGTSAGSIIGCLISLGLSAEELTQEQLQLDYATLIDVDLKDPPVGIVKGEKFLDWMRSMVEKYLGNSNATFKDLWAKRQANPRYKDFHAYSVNIDNKLIYEFSYQTTPDVPIAEAVRASMSIPIFFKVWEFSGELAKKYPGGFIDGGVMYNYPITTFDSDGINERTLGFYLDNLSFSDESLLELFFHLIEYQLMGQSTSAEIIKALFENYIQFVKDFMRLKKSGLAGNKACEDLKENLITNLKQYTLDSGCKIDNALLQAFSFITDENKESQAKLKELDKTFLSKMGLPDWVGEIFDDLMTYSKVIGASINLPTNIKFSLDSQRTIFLNELGYHFADFWMPMCNKNHLIDAGNTTTQLYLQRMLY